MSYQPYNSNASGIVFFGNPTAGPVYTSESSFVYDQSNDRLHVGSIAVDDGSYIGSDSHNNILQLNNDGTATFSSGLTINGDLLVEGTTFTVNSETVTIDDNFIVLNDNNPGLDQDAGIEVGRGTNGTNTVFMWDEGEDVWKFTNNGSNYQTIEHVIARSGLIESSSSLGTNTIDIGQGTGILVNDNDININITGLTELTSSATDDYLLIYDTDATAHKKISKNNLLTGLGGGTITSIDVNGGSGITVPESGPITSSGTFTVNVNVDNSTLEVHTDDNLRVRDLGIDTAQLAAGAVTEAKRERTVGTYNSTSSINDDIALGSGLITLTLPTPASGKMVFVKRTDANSGALTISGGSANIDGASNKVLYYQYESINVVSDGTNWFIV